MDGRKIYFQSKVAWCMLALLFPLIVKEKIQNIQRINNAQWIWRNWTAAFQESKYQWVFIGNIKYPFSRTLPHLHKIQRES